MISFPEGWQLLDEPSELPPIPSDGIRELFGDFETSSQDSKVMSTNPWDRRHCHTIGAAVAFGIDSPIWFVPKRLLITGWWRDVLAASDKWINHNIKYDAHVSTNDLSCPPPRKLRLICTLNDSKLIDSDMGFKGGFGLDNLSEKWCGYSMQERCESLLPYLQDNKDYGRIPIDILAWYACSDVYGNRKLWRHVQENMPEESRYVWEKEHEVTELLYRIENHGCLVNPSDVKKSEMRTLIRMFEIDKELREATGRDVLPTSPKDCYDVLCNQYGLPVLAWTDANPETGKPPTPSFDKDALKLYAKHPKSPKNVVKLLMEYKSCSTYKSLFLEAWQELVDPTGYLHGTYNQSVRTGRMSCSSPNFQQLSMIAKMLIIPPPGYGIVVADASQLEFRIIGHYTENKRIVQAYLANPWTDFHQFVADGVPCARTPAKTLNFMMGYGGGKKKTIYSLAINEDFVGAIVKEVEASGIREEQKLAMVNALCEQKALQIYSDYHTKLLPELKPTSRQATARAKIKGYVRNHSGRRRYLPDNRAHTAFNSACQSSAGDMVKDRMVALDREVPELIQIAQVHDEIVGYAPLELLEAPGDPLLHRIIDVLCAPEKPFRVPIRWSIGWSSKSWAHAKSKEREMHLEPSYGVQAL